MQTIYHLKEPQMDREEDVRTIIQTFLFQFSEKAYGGPSFNRPACCFAPHIYGAGKTFVGQNFLAYLNIFAERECSNAQTFQQLHSSNDNPQPSELKVPWKHFAEQTLSVILELRESFSDAPFPRFLEALLYNIILNAYRQNGRRKDAAHVASTIIRELNLDDAIDYLLEQFQKQYLFLMIDELSHLSYLTKYYSELGEEQFIESDPKYVPFRNFFRILRDLLITGKVIVYLAGRTAEISAPLSDTRSSRVSLRMLRLNPFNLRDINEYIELATYDGKSLKDWLLPSDGIRHRFLELLKKKTGGIPLILKNTLLALVRKVANLSQPAINNDNMELLLDGVFRSLLLHSLTFIIPEILDSATLLRYEFVFLNYQLGTVFPIGFAITLCGTRTYLMDLVATFGFYSEICETDGIDLGTKFKIGCCEFILRAHSNYKFFREATELFPLSPFSYIPDTSTAKGVFFEFVFMKIFRFRLLTFLHSSSSPIVHSAIPGIFQGSFIEQDNVSYSMESTKSNDIPILREMSLIHFLTIMENFYNVVVFLFQKMAIRVVLMHMLYSIMDKHVMLLDFHLNFITKLDFRKQILRRKQNNFSKKYDRSVGFSVEEHNIVEDASYLVTEHSAGSTLNESSRSCLQLVIVSQRNLERFFGIENFDILRKIGKASREEFRKDFSVWCKTVFESMSDEYVSPLEAKPFNVTLRVARNIRPRTNEENRMQMEGFQTAMQVEEGNTRSEQRVAASSSLSSSFDWNTFLRDRCGLSEEDVAYCLPRLSFIGMIDLSGVTTEFLLKCGIDSPSLRLRIMLGIRQFLAK
ncbi:archaeal ATPase [Galdieria sulphuraria]|uniref:Archaeal ATPase n=1 Tax=Galdieria sulphuraria TaxID=130081 RepID=M2XQM5_GALSU|nr:archaeal ATPase [Galdieria sulphuraria]EME25918.1 archaeal ATPase [Galdieria sulphuraria]|eukprot:XP_005702438.1 archaeal ATPase [Galdieria sulphuraria]